MTTAAELVERARGDLDRVEKLMLAEPELIEVLKPERALAQRELADAEMRATVAEQAVERPTREAMWQLWCDCRVLGRRRMSARTKAKAVRWFGPLYKQLPW